MELLQIGSYRARHHAHLSIFNIDYLCDKRLQEITVMGNDDVRAGKVIQRLLQHCLGGHVKVVGRLIKDEKICLHKKHLGKGEAALFSA